MKYEKILSGVFLRRPNRFIAEIMVHGKVEICHVKNTGRCKEILVPGAEVYVQFCGNSSRKTAFDLIAVRKGELLINIDSQAPNRAVLERIRQGQLFGEIDSVKPECAFGTSRFDFYVETGKRKIFVEVKGVTLEDSGTACFPDAPTQRGVKHLEGLMDCVSAGYEAYVIFVIQMKGPRVFRPNWETHPAFGETLCRAWKAGVRIKAYDCLITPESIEMDQTVPIELERE